MKGMNLVKEHISAYTGLGFYTVLGAIIRYLVTYPCDSSFESIVKPYAIGFILIGIVFGVGSFIFRNKKPSGNKQILFDWGRGIITGFGLGWGGMTVWIFVFPCG
jgi:hypothetical protein